MEDKRITDQQQQTGAGRISLEDKECFDEQGNLIKTSGRDISEIDCQEGTMHHGAKGGNFEEPEEESANESQRP
jgi:hypothetical protein